MAMAQSPSAPFRGLLPSSFPSPFPRPSLSAISWSPPKKRPACSRVLASLKHGVEEIAELAHNKVLIAATVASAIGQLSKPFTSVKNGESGVDFRAAIRSGGMPSTHSAGVVAVATSLGLERGFSDSVFGMSVVFAAIVMYDAQGVRREVGNHAKVLNKRLASGGNAGLITSEDDIVSSSPELVAINSDRTAPLISVPENATSYQSNADSYSSCSSGNISSTLNGIKTSKVEVTETQEKADTDYYPLNEWVGHTELQVLVGALLGFVVSLAIDAVL